NGNLLKNHGYNYDVIIKYFTDFTFKQKKKEAIVCEINNVKFVDFLTIFVVKVIFIIFFIFNNNFEGDFKKNSIIILQNVKTVNMFEKDIYLIENVSQIKKIC